MRDRVEIRDRQVHCLGGLLHLVNDRELLARVEAAKPESLEPFLEQLVLDAPQ